MRPPYYYKLNLCKVGAMNTKASGVQRSDGTSRRNEVLTALRSSPTPRTIVDLAEALGVHPNTIRFHLDTLATMGRVERLGGVPVGVGRPAAGYRATAGMDPDGPTNYRFLATVLTTHLADNSQDPAADARSLGYRWSEALMAPRRATVKTTRTSATTRGAAVKQVASVLAELDFAPEPVGPRSAEIRLRHCPFLDLASRNPEIICSLHLGLMQGAFNALGGPVTVDRLDPFVEPDLCIARLDLSIAKSTRKPQGKIPT